MDAEEKRHNHINYLMKAASVLPSNSHFHKLLRSYYLTKCERLTQIGDGTNGNNLFSEEEMCKKCSTPWFDANFSLSIAPKKATKRKAQKIQKKIDNNTNQKSNLTKKLSKKMNNTVTVTCKLCNNKNKILLWMKSSTSKKSALETNKAAKESKILEAKVSDTILLEPKNKPKKKRKKDKNAGLLYSINTAENSMKVVNNVKQKLQQLNIQKSSFSSIPNQNIKRHPTPNKNELNLQIQSKVNIKSSAKKGAKNVFQPTPKRNNLLQLANALKAKGNQSGSNSQADKLKQLLK